ncbi:unnamed protein product [Prunus armeniaca]|uniref:Retrotransposon Copia-like N-terminal domain-containing protein n=1 Tax=Prunus armeniaca TaxID=36596 RepID=A0A6J5UGP9_PRUAR|nr:unnamed protein product [Prunus armeniaca]
MVTASQLQLLQSPITALISSISTSVNVKLDDSNYLNWNFQMQLLLESNGIMGYVDGSIPCPSQHGSTSDESGIISSSPTDEYMVWKMHDRAIMQLITTTLSPIAMSCAIGSTSSKDLWIRLKEQFSTYLHRIKEARDYLSAAGVYFADEDIVILALNGLPAEYNTFRCVIRGRESVISLKDFRSQLLAEETIVEHSVNTPLMTAMVANTGSTYTKGPPFQPQSFSPHSCVFPYGTYASHSTLGVLGQSPGQQFGIPSAPMIQICQLCNSEGHTAPFCGASHEKTKCHICGRSNHTHLYTSYQALLSIPHSHLHSFGSATFYASHAHSAQFCISIIQFFRFFSDKATGRILYRGLCSNGLYPIHSLSTSNYRHLQAKAFLGQLVQSNLWHHRLGHPTNNVVL